MNALTPRVFSEAICRKRIRWGEFFIERGIAGASLLSLAFIALIFIFIFREASALFSAAHARTETATHLEDQQMESYGEEMVATGSEETVELLQDKKTETLWRLLFSREWQPVSLNPRFGLLPIVIGSFKVAIIAILVGAPLAVFAALYCAMFAPVWVKETIKPVIEILAGFPSVVIGFFALIVLASYLQNAFGLQFRLNALTGGIALSLAVIPIIFTISEDSLAAVPRSLTEASLALGARKWQTALFVVMPAATPGIFASILLGVGRAVGETMIALMATGNAALISANPVEPVRTMAATIGAEMAEVVFGDAHYSVLFFVGVVLFIFSFIINWIAEFFIRKRLMRRFRGE